MPRQTFLDFEPKRAAKGPFLVNWNINNPSESRAAKQAEFLLQQAPEVIVLTEAKPSAGCRYMKDRLLDSGYRVFGLPESGYGSMIACAFKDAREKASPVGFLPERAVLVGGTSSVGEIQILGVYVPSRGALGRRDVDKACFQKEISKNIGHLAKEGKVIVAGDFNVVERGHIPFHQVFGEWEYGFYDSFKRVGLYDAFRQLNPALHDHSWYGRSGEGYRFDHIFIPKVLLEKAAKCYYLHEPRAS